MLTSCGILTGSDIRKLPWDILLLITGVSFIVCARYLKMAWPVAALVITIALYLGLRSTNTWSGEQLVDTAEEAIDESRAQSLAFRLAHERLLAEKALQEPLFGWASEYRVTGEEGEDISVTDSMWIITFGRNGYVGLIALLLFFLLPSLVFVVRYPVARWADPPLFVGAVFAMLLPLYMVDNLLNNFPNPVYIMMLGALTGLIATVRYVRPRRAPAHAGPPGDARAAPHPPPRRTPARHRPQPEPQAPPQPNHP